MRGRAGGAVLVTAAIVLLAPGRAAAMQAGGPADAPAGDVTYLSVNAVLGGLTAGLTSRARGGTFLSPFARGMLGGAVSYAGKRMSGGAFWGAGLVGRQIAAAGSSIVRSASFGGGLLDTLLVPLGPGRLHVPVSAGGGPTYTVDLEEVVWLGYGLTRDHLTLDVSESLSSGAFVFSGDERLRGEHDNAIGRAAPGVISIRRSDGDLDEGTLAHERVHIAQLDHLKIVWGLPFEGWLRREWGVPTGGWLGHVELGMGHYPMLWILTAPWSSHAARPLEKEAEHVERVRRGG